MAVCDYGVLVKKNGVIINKDLFTPMEETLGFVNKDDSLFFNKHFIYLGDADLYIGIYKNFIDVYKNKTEKVIRIYDLNHYTNYESTKYRYKTKIEGINFNIRRLDEGNRYFLRFHYKNDLYEIIYGYGVAFSINYWEGLTPKLKRWVENFINN